MATRKQILDNDNNEILPITDTDAVRNPQSIGGTLESRLQNIEEDIENNQEAIENNNLLVEQSSLTDQQRNTALANVSNQTANATTGKMGYKVLDPTKTFASQVTAENTIYEIRDVFDLGGTQETPISVTLPAGSTLKFNGGMVKNCTIIGENSTIVSSNGNIFDNVLFNGTFENEFVAEWLLPKYDANRDYTDDLTYVFNCGAKCIRFTSAYTYNVTSTIVINDDVVICSSIPFNGAITTKNIQPIIKSTDNITVIEYHHRTGQSKIVLEGLKIMSGDSNTPDYSTPIVYIEMNVSGWQSADIDLSITYNVKYVDYEGETYARYCMVGLEVNTLQGSFTLANIKGQFACYKGVYIHGDKFITDINIESRMECCYGGEINGSYIYLRGKFQTLPFPNNNSSIRPSESFFYGCSKIIQESLVWDVNTKRGSLSSVKNGVVNACVSLQDSLLENTSIIPNYPTEQSTSFINANCGYFLTEGDVNLLDIQCSQDDFVTILFTKDDFVNINSLFSNYIKVNYNNNVNGELANIAPFIKTNSLQNSNVDITKPLQIKITLRYTRISAHWLRLYSRYYIETLVVRRLYSDSSYTSIIDEKTYNPTASSGGQSLTNRSTLCFLPYVDENGYNELVITYSVDADRTIYNQSTYFLIGFNIFSFDTKSNRYISYETNRIYTDWIITRPSMYYSVYYPKTLVNCNQGFVIVAPTTLPTDMHILLKLYPSDGLSDYIAKTQRDCVIVVKTNGNVTISGLSGDAVVYKSDHEVSGLSYYRFLIPNMFCSVLQIKGKCVQLEGFVRAGGTSVGTNQTTLTLTKCYVVSTSANRPILVAREVGYQYFDTTLGKPIWWNGTNWVDSTGTVV